MIFHVKVSRKFWPWPKQYKCKGMEWCSIETNKVPDNILLLILLDETRVWIDTTGRIITYGPEFFRWVLQNTEEAAGQTIPIREN